MKTCEISLSFQSKILNLLSLTQIWKKKWMYVQWNIDIFMYYNEWGTYIKYVGMHTNNESIYGIKYWIGLSNIY